MESCERLESLAAVSDFRPCGVSFDNRERHSDSRSARARGPRAAGPAGCAPRPVQSVRTRAPRDRPPAGRVKSRVRRGRAARLFHWF